MEDIVALSQIIRNMYALHEEIKTSLKLSKTNVLGCPLLDCLILILIVYCHAAIFSTLVSNWQSSCNNKLNMLTIFPKHGF